MKDSIKIAVILSLLPLQAKAMYSSSRNYIDFAEIDRQSEAMAQIFTLFGQNAAAQKKIEEEKEKTESQRIQLVLFQQLQALKNDLSQPVQQISEEINLTEEYQKLLAQYTETPPIGQFEIAWNRISQSTHRELFNNLEKIAVFSHKTKSEDFKVILQRILAHSAHAYALALSFPLLQQQVATDQALKQEQERRQKAEEDLESLRKEINERASKNK